MRQLWDIVKTAGALVAAFVAIIIVFFTFFFQPTPAQGDVAEYGAEASAIVDKL